MFYNSSDGCDVCGSDSVGPADPDCDDENATRFRWNDPARDFSVEFAKVDSAVQHGATTTEACQKHLADAKESSTVAASTSSEAQASKSNDGTNNTGLKVAVG